MPSWTLQPSTDSAVFYGKSPFDSLRANPLLYPGRIPKESFLYRRGHTWPLTIAPGMRATRARIGWRDADGRVRRTALGNALLRWGATDVTRRVPVLAIGSNAYPRQLADKFLDTFIDDTIPSFAGTLSNIEIVFCAFVGTYGYVPVTPRYRPGAASRAFLQLLAPNQLAEIVKTESSYRLVALPASTARFQLAGSREVLPVAYVFWHSDVLRCFGDLPPVCDGTLADGVDDELRRRVRSHHDLVDALLEELGYPDVQQITDAHVRCRLGELLLSRATANDLPPGASVVQSLDACERYAEMAGAFQEPAVAGSLRVLRTGPVRARRGRYETLAYMNEEERRTLGIGGDAAAVAWPESPSEQGPRLAVPVRVVSARKNSRAPDHGTVRLDQMARVAVGVSVGESCRMVPVDVPLQFRVARFVGRVFGARSLVGRAVRASETVMERPVCWTDAGVLNALGIDSGGEVVLSTAIPDRHGSRFRLAACRLQVLAATSGQVEDRTAISHPDDAAARFPHPAEILGVLPDLPWIWLDEQARETLGLLQMHPTSPVAIRPSTRYLFLRAASRFVLATLGIGASLAIVVYRVWGAWYPAVRWFGLPAADAASLAVLVATLAAASTAIFFNARRP